MEMLGGGDRQIMLKEVGWTEFVRCVNKADVEEREMD